jgi:hypothetical protein
VKHWINSFESNREAAEFILAHPENGALDCLRPWARSWLERHPESSPIEPAEQLELGVNS